MENEPTPGMRAAGFGLCAAGLLGLAANGQVLALLVFASPWVGAIPVALGAASLAAIPVGAAYAGARGWARPLAALLAVGLAVGGSALALWLTVNGFLSPLVVFAPSAAALGAMLQAFLWGAHARLSRRLAEVRAENERLLKEAAAAGDPLFSSPPSRGGLAFWGVAVPVAAFPVGLFGLALTYPDAFEALTWRTRAVAVGANPFTGPAFATTAADFPYDGDPLEWYLDYEARWLPVDRAQVLAFADGIARDTARRLLVETGERDLGAAELALWEQMRQNELPRWVAAGLRARGAFYAPESLLSRSFDPDVHVLPDTVHLDCDQLVYVFLHVARKLDLGMQAVPGPYHVYLRYFPPGEPDAPDDEAMWVETTNFRGPVDQHARTLEEGLSREEDEHFLIAADYHPTGRGGVTATTDLVEAAGYYRPSDARRIHDSIVANVLVGVKRKGIDAPFREELEAREDGSRDVTLVANLFRRYLDDGDDALEAGRADEAVALARKAAELRARHGPLVAVGDLREQGLLARALFVTGDTAGAATAAQAVIESYRPEGWSLPDAAWNRVHADALLTDAEARGPLPAAEADAIALSVVAWADRGREGASEARDRACGVALAADRGPRRGLPVALGGCR